MRGGIINCRSLYQFYNVRFGAQIFESSLACLGSREQGSRAGIQVDLSENSLENLLQAFCHIVVVADCVTLLIGGRVTE